MLPVGMDHGADVSSGEMVSVTESDSCETASFERSHGHAALHNTPRRHFTVRSLPAEIE